MKKYILFIWSLYYPSGGMKDIHDSYDTIQECHNAFQTQSNIPEDYRRGQIVDRDTWEVVEKLEL
jgi:hypothetical protein